MPYLPSTTNAPTIRPTPFGKDFAMQVRNAAEKWRLYFPVVTYHRIKLETTHADASDPDVPVGEMGTTKWDGLYGETVDPDQTVLVQPHLSEAEFKPGAVEVYEDPVSVVLRTNVEATDTDLKRWGFEKKEDMVAIAAASLLDAASITVRAGDWFQWSDWQYTVKQVGFDGRWKNTTANLYVVLNCVTRRFGS